MLLVLYLVYITGGTKKAYLHFFYIPIVLACLFWGPTGGLLSGVVSGFLAGPFMPLDVASGEMQSPINWISRIIIFSLIGVVVGYISNQMDKMNKAERERLQRSPFYQLPNVSKLLLDIEENIKSGKVFKLISVKLTNIEGIEKYVDTVVTEKLIETLIENLKHGEGIVTVYGSAKDEFVSLICSEDVEDYEEEIKRIVEKYSTSPVSLDGYTFRLSLKVGIYEYHGNEDSPVEILNRSRIAFEQGTKDESNVYHYDTRLEESRREAYDITGALLDSIRNDELFLMYQPKIDIANHRVSGAEALVRWKRKDKGVVGPNLFIPIAEDVGFIKEITKFVFDSATAQMETWKRKGLDIKCAINVSGMELLDQDFITWGQKMISSRNIDRADMELEITERAVTHNNESLIEAMHYLSGLGYKISIDDFGTGYNTLMNIGELPFDILKIDKYFIDRMNSFKIMELVRCVITLSHVLGKVVIAEGVETAEQLDLLREMKCDRVQGYYYSKPLLPHEFEEYYARFTK